MNKTLITVLVALTALAGTALLVRQLTKNHTPKKVEVPTPVFDAWVHWKSSNKRAYGGAEEENHRLGVFYNNFQKIQKHMAKTTRTFDMSLNSFADLTAAEFKAAYLSVHVKKTKLNIVEDTAAPAPSVDWRTKGVVTAVKDQGQCGSCCAFSTTGALESAGAIAGKGLQSFSEQQLVDCSGSYGNQGCNGGLMDYGFQYVQDKGITLESKYPYRAVDQSCKTDGGAFKITGFTDVPAGNVASLASAVNKQPIAVAVDAENWQFYSGGVFSDCSSNLDHGVLLVGYTADYWIVKNSWNTSWGEDGYIRLARGNTCGIAAAASYPQV